MKILNSNDIVQANIKKFNIMDYPFSTVDDGSYYDKRVHERLESLEALEEKKAAEIEKAVELGREKGLAEGREEGYNAAYSDFIQSSKEEIEKIKSEKDMLLKAVDHELDAFIARKKDEFFELVLSITRKVLFGAVEKDDVFADYTENFLEYFMERYDTLEINLRQDTYDRLLSTDKGRRLFKSMGDKGIAVNLNSRIKINDFIIKTPNENVELFLEKQLEKIRSTFR